LQALLQKTRSLLHEESKKRVLLQPYIYTNPATDPETYTSFVSLYVSGGRVFPVAEKPENISHTVADILYEALSELVKADLA
jgi:hypothetical protein